MNAPHRHETHPAIANAKTTLIEDHLDHCLEHVMGPLDAEKRREIDEFKKMARYL